MKALLLAIVALLPACVQYVPLQISSEAPGVHETPVAIVSGHASADFVLIFGPFGDDSLEAAWLDALKGVEADTLVNVMADRKITYFPFPMLSFFTSVETRIMGTAVKYKETVWNMPKAKALMDAK